MHPASVALSLRQTEGWASGRQIAWKTPRTRPHSTRSRNVASRPRPWVPPSNTRRAHRGLAATGDSVTRFPTRNTFASAQDSFSRVVPAGHPRASTATCSSETTSGIWLAEVLCERTLPSDAERHRIRHPDAERGHVVISILGDEQVDCCQHMRRLTVTTRTRLRSLPRTRDRARPRTMGARPVSCLRCRERAPYSRTGARRRRRHGRTVPMVMK